MATEQGNEREGKKEISDSETETSVGAPWTINSCKATRVPTTRTSLIDGSHPYRHSLNRLGTKGGTRRADGMVHVSRSGRS